MDASQFTLGSSASDSSDRFIYDQSTGALFFDVDGAGGVDQVQFAILSTGPNLSADDFIVI